MSSLQHATPSSTPLISCIRAQRVTGRLLRFQLSTHGACQETRGLLADPGYWMVGQNCIHCKWSPLLEQMLELSRVRSWTCELPASGLQELCKVAVMQSSYHQRCVLRAQGSSLGKLQGEVEPCACHHLLPGVQANSQRPRLQPKPVIPETHSSMKPTNSEA